MGQNSPTGNTSSLSESSDSLLCGHGMLFEFNVTPSFFLTGRSQYCSQSSTWGFVSSLIRVTNPPPRISPRFPTRGRPPFQLPTSAGQFPRFQYQSATIASVNVQCLLVQTLPDSAVAPSPANGWSGFQNPKSYCPVPLAFRCDRH